MSLDSVAVDSAGIFPCTVHLINGYIFDGLDSVSDQKLPKIKWVRAASRRANLMSCFGFAVEVLTMPLCCGVHVANFLGCLEKHHNNFGLSFKFLGQLCDPAVSFPVAT